MKGGIRLLLASNALRATATNGDPHLVPSRPPSTEDRYVSHLPGITQSDNRKTDSITNRWNSTPHLDNTIVGVDTIRVRGLHNGHDLRRKTKRTLVGPTTGEIRVVGSKSYQGPGKVAC